MARGFWQGLAGANQEAMRLRADAARSKAALQGTQESSILAGHAAKVGRDFTADQNMATRASAAEEAQNTRMFQGQQAKILAEANWANAEADRTSREYIAGLNRDAASAGSGKSLAELNQESLTKYDASLRGQQAQKLEQLSDQSLDADSKAMARSQLSDIESELESVGEEFRKRSAMPAAAPREVSTVDPIAEAITRIMQPAAPASPAVSVAPVAPTSTPRKGAAWVQLTNKQPALK